MRVLILGGDGCLGWPTAMFLSSGGHEGAGVGNYFHRRACPELNRKPLFPMPNLHQRPALWEALRCCRVGGHIGDFCNYPFLLRASADSSPTG